MSPKAFTKNHQEKPSVSQFVFFHFILLQLFRDKTWLSPVGLGLMCVKLTFTLPQGGFLKYVSRDGKVA